MTPAELARDGLAVYRFVRLVTRDELTRPWRDRILEPVIERGDPHFAPDPDLGGHESLVTPSRADVVRARVAYGVTCPWCLSVWAAGLLALVHRAAPQVGTTLAEVGAVAQLAGMLADRDRG